MKSIMISIRPRWCEEIKLGNKVVEVRKNKPKNSDEPFKCYIYETQGNKRTKKDINGAGKVIGEFICTSVEKYTYGEDNVHLLNETKLVSLSCVPAEELYEYLKGSEAYAWNITDLKLYSKSKSITRYNLAVPPQSWCYIPE